MIRRNDAGATISATPSAARGLHTVIATLFLILAIGAATAFADDPPPASQEATTYTPGWTSLPELERASNEADTIIIPEPSVDSEAAAALPHEDLSRDEAIELVTSVFGDVIEKPASLFEDLDIRGFRSDHVALVESDDPVSPAGPVSQPGLLSSVLPLRAEGDDGEKESIALELEASEGELQPLNPLVEVGLPAQLGDGISLPEPGVSIELVDAPDRTASNMGTAAFYPNVAPESDLAVTPTPTGVETFMQLRSDAAPKAHVFRLGIPVGAELNGTPDGGAIVATDDSTLLLVRPPSGIDAEGNPVSVELEISGNSITVRATPTAENVYPLLIDPIFESFSWEQLGAESSEWLPASSPGLTATWGAWGGPGMVMYSGNFSNVAPGAQANWNYYVPRFFTDMAQVGSRPTTYIKKMTMSKLSFFWNFTPWSPGPGSPVLMMGLWSESKGQWVSVGTRDGFQGPLNDPNYQYVFVNPNEVTDAKNGGIALATTESPLPAQRNVKVEQATVELSDKDSPGFGSLGSPAPWVNGQPTAPITYKVTDPGLGVREVQVIQPTAGPASSSSTTSANCLGTVGKPCPRSLQNIQHPLQYDPATMPQGENWLRIVAKDPVLQEAAGEARVKVDHTKPTLALSGTLTEQAKVGTNAAQYALKYDAADGDSALPAAQTPFGTPGTGVGQLQRPMGVALDGEGNRWVVDRECKCVQKYGPSGNFLKQFTAASPSADLRGIAVTATGNIWVADLGSKGVYQIDPDGELNRVINYGGFVEPYAVATGPGDTLWVSDIGADKVWKFGGSNTPIGPVYGTKANPGQNQADLAGPVGLAVDGAGTIWVVDNGLNRVTAYNSNRQWIGQFGSGGAGNGQFNNPVGIAVAPVTGNLLVADGNNNRVQEFRPNGEYIRQFGATGAANNQFSEPRGIALGADRTLYVADAGNDRIAKWTHASYDPQSGVASTEVRIDGTLVEPKHAPGCATKDCAISREWTLNADQFSVGQHALEVTATDAVGLSTTKSLTIETHGDLAPPALALSGSMTEQPTLGTTRPTYTLNVNATDPGGAGERESGVASATIKVDGTTVDSTSPGCPAGGCSISREWTLNSNGYSVGEHSVQVTATDAAGRVATKSLTITINRDTTPPEINTSGPFNGLFNRPEGWVEQKSYYYLPYATDDGGYGVTFVALKMDGTTIKSTTKTCAGGSCEANLFGSLNMANYDGGAHTAEVIATDGAGNTRKRTWTINVDPAGQITVGEAEDTLEALEMTTDINAIGPPEEEDDRDATGPGLGLQAIDGGIETTGTAVPARIATEPDGGIELKILEDEAFLSNCDEEAASETEEACLEPGEEEFGLEPIVIEPVSTSAAATETEIADDSATVTANVGNHVDAIVRPLLDGAMTFQAIRDASAPETYSWRVDLAPDQELRVIDSQNVGVYYSNNRLAFSIKAELAHDAIGSTVPTSLTVSQDKIVTLAVRHRDPSPTSGSFVYPVVAGAGWEGGFHTYEIAMPPPVKWEEEEEGGVGTDGALVQVRTYGPPKAEPVTPAIEQLGYPAIEPIERRFKFVYCKPHEIPGSAGIREIPPFEWFSNVPKIVSECNHPALEGIYWKTSVHGWFHYKAHRWVWITNFNAGWCDKGGSEPPAKAGCKVFRNEPGHGPANAVHGPIELVGQFVFPPNYGGWEFYTRKVCFEMGGRLYPKLVAIYPGEPIPPYERPLVWDYTAPASTENCEWR